MSGFEVCRRLRETGQELPVILVTARDASTTGSSGSTRERTTT